MFDVANYSISFIQISSDISCVLISAFLSKCIKTNRLFYLLNFFSFIALSFSDLYYNYFYRILQENILQSAQLLETLPLLIFQFLQSINWYILLKKETKIISWLNLPYLLFAAIVTAIFGYFFYITHSLSSISTMEDIFTVAIDMCIWVFTIISLGRTKNSAIALLALGCLMIVSSDLTFTCLFMFDMKNVGITNWPHLVWAVGAFLMMLGLIRSKNQINLTFYDPNSIHAKSNWWLLMSSLIAFLIGLALPFFFIESDNVYTIRYALWDVPISLMFTMIASTLLSNRFSRVILSPIKSFSNSIESFNMGKQSEILVSSDINEIKILEQFINKSFKELSGKLEQEVKISAQVAHDVRSPLSALEVVIKSLPSSFDESKRILLRDAVQHIRDITNNLDKTDAYSNSNIKYPSQVSVLVDNVVSERRLARQERNIKLEQLYGSDTYEYFSEIVPSMLKRILSNILNNSYEAIDCASGIITVSIKEFNGMCVLSIRDNGHGVSVSPNTSI